MELDLKSFALTLAIGAFAVSLVIHIFQLWFFAGTRRERPVFILLALFLGKDPTAKDPSSDWPVSPEEGLPPPPGPPSPEKAEPEGLGILRVALLGAIVLCTGAVVQSISDHLVSNTPWGLRFLLQSTTEIRFKCLVKKFSETPRDDHGKSTEFSADPTPLLIDFKRAFSTRTDPASSNFVFKERFKLLNSVEEGKANTKNGKSNNATTPATVPTAAGETPAQPMLVERSKQELAKRTPQSIITGTQEDLMNEATAAYYDAKNRVMRQPSYFTELSQMHALAGFCASMMFLLAAYGLVYIITLVLLLINPAAPKWVADIKCTRRQCAIAFLSFAILAYATHHAYVAATTEYDKRVFGYYISLNCDPDAKKVGN